MSKRKGVKNLGIYILVLVLIIAIASLIYINLPDSSGKIKSIEGVKSFISNLFQQVSLSPQCSAGQVVDKYGNCHNIECYSRSDSCISSPFSVCQNGLCDLKKCSSNADCPSDTKCGFGFCMKPQCQINFDCGSSGKSICYNQLCFKKQCDVNTDCNSWQVCNSNLCQTRQCTINSDCGSGSSCDNGICKSSECSNDKDCGIGKACNNGICKFVSCKSNNECNPGSYCINNYCSVAQCTSILDCGGTQVCNGIQCVNTCNKASDCGSGSSCINHVCCIGGNCPNMDKIPNERCDDGIDNNLNGLIDYADPACQNQCLSPNKITYQIIGKNLNNNGAPTLIVNNFTTAGCCNSNQCFFAGQGCVNDGFLVTINNGYNSESSLCKVNESSAVWCKSGYINDGSSQFISWSGTGWTGTNSGSSIGLPSGFIPTVGYYHPFNGGKVTLFNTNGQLIVYNGNSWSSIITPSGNGSDGQVPRGFVPIVGYYQQFNGGRVVLWNSQGQYVAWNGISWTPIITPGGSGNGFPSGFIPTVGYYSQFNGGRTTLWNSQGQFIVYNGTKWTSINTPNGNGSDGQVPRGFVPIVGYYHSIGGGGVTLLNAKGQFIVYNGNSWSSIITPSGNGNDGKIPSGFIPTVGYFDNISAIQKITLWSGAGNCVQCLASCSGKTCGTTNGCGGICYQGSGCNNPAPNPGPGGIPKPTITSINCLSIRQCPSIQCVRAPCPYYTCSNRKCVLWST